MSELKKICKKCLSFAGIDLTKNMQYDRFTWKVLKKVLRDSSNCIDIGSHDGEVLKQMIRLAPNGQHYAFEPIPALYKALKKHYGKQVTVLPYALSDKEGKARFHYVRNAPAYSGLRKRKYDTPVPDIENIEVESRMLDLVIPNHVHIDFIKIDVEGAEYLVLQGAKNLIKRCRPFIVFEFGIGASDFYRTEPSALYDLLVKDAGLHISLLNDFLSESTPLTFDHFISHYQNQTEYYFIAHP